MSKIVAIVLNWNGFNDTTCCIQSLMDMSYNNLEIILVDNNSSGNDIEIIRNKFKSITIIKNDSNYGFAEGNNIGIRYALDKLNSTHILLINNDAIADKNMLDELTSAINDFKIGIVGAVLYHYDRPNIIQMAGGKIDMWKGRRESFRSNEMDKGQYVKNHDVDFVSGAAMLIDSNVFRKIGMLNKDYFTYTEDIDFCFRAKKAGYRILIVSSAKVWHKTSISTGGFMSPTSLYYVCRNTIIFMSKHAKSYQIPSYIIFSFFYFLRRLTSVNLLQAKSMFKGVISSFIHIFGRH